MSEKPQRKTQDIQSTKRVINPEAPCRCGSGNYCHRHVMYGLTRAQSEELARVETFDHHHHFPRRPKYLTAGIRDDDQT
jgi:hypothetical protein